MIIMDTNVVSELMRPTPDLAVLTWALNAESELRVTTPTVAEIRYGIARLPEGRHRESISAAADRRLRGFAPRIVPFDYAAAVRFGELKARRRSIGRPITTFDAQIAAICLARSAALATRNVKDFDGLGITVIDPWNL
jgi:predicted nucleic acid-binding protein